MDTSSSSLLARCKAAPSKAAGSSTSPQDQKKALPFRASPFNPIAHSASETKLKARTEAAAKSASEAALRARVEAAAKMLNRGVDELGKQRIYNPNSDSESRSSRNKKSFSPATKGENAGGGGNGEHSPATPAKVPKKQPGGAWSSHHQRSHHQHHHHQRSTANNDKGATPSSGSNFFFQFTEEKPEPSSVPPCPKTLPSSSNPSIHEGGGAAQMGNSTTKSDGRNKSPGFSGLRMGSPTTMMNMRTPPPGSTSPTLRGNVSSPLVPFVPASEARYQQESPALRIASEDPVMSLPYFLFPSIPPPSPIFRHPVTDNERNEHASSSLSNPPPWSPAAVATSTQGNLAKPNEGARSRGVSPKMTGAVVASEELVTQRKAEEFLEHNQRLHGNSSTDMRKRLNEQRKYVIELTEERQRNVDREIRWNNQIQELMRQKTDGETAMNEEVNSLTDEITYLTQQLQSIVASRDNLRAELTNARILRGKAIEWIGDMRVRDRDDAQMASSLNEWRMITVYYRNERTFTSISEKWLHSESIKRLAHSNLWNVGLKAASRKERKLLTAAFTEWRLIVSESIRDASVLQIAKMTTKRNEDRICMLEHSFDQMRLRDITTEWNRVIARESREKIKKLNLQIHGMQARYQQQVFLTCLKWAEFALLRSHFNAWRDLLLKRRLEAEEKQRNDVISNLQLKLDETETFMRKRLYYEWMMRSDERLKFHLLRLFLTWALLAKGRRRTVQVGKMRRKSIDAFTKSSAIAFESSPQGLLVTSLEGWMCCVRETKNQVLVKQQEKITRMELENKKMQKLLKTSLILLKTRDYIVFMGFHFREWLSFTTDRKAKQLAAENTRNEITTVKYRWIERCDKIFDDFRKKRRLHVLGSFFKQWTLNMQEDEIHHLKDEMQSVNDIYRKKVSKLVGSIRNYFSTKRVNNTFLSEIISHWRFASENQCLAAAVLATDAKEKMVCTWVDNSMQALADKTNLQCTLGSWKMFLTSARKVRKTKQMTEILSHVLLTNSEEGTNTVATRNAPLAPLLLETNMPVRELKHICFRYWHNDMNKMRRIRKKLEMEKMSDSIQKLEHAKETTMTKASFAIKASMERISKEAIFRSWRRIAKCSLHEAEMAKSEERIRISDETNLKLLGKISATIFRIFGDLGKRAVFGEWQKITRQSSQEKELARFAEQMRMADEARFELLGKISTTISRVTGNLSARSVFDEWHKITKQSSHEKELAQSAEKMRLAKLESQTIMLKFISTSEEKLLPIYFLSWKQTVDNHTRLIKTLNIMREATGNNNEQLLGQVFGGWRRIYLEERNARLHAKLKIQVLERERKLFDSVRKAFMQSTSDCDSALLSNCISSWVQVVAMSRSERMQLQYERDIAAVRQRRKMHLTKMCVLMFGGNKPSRRTLSKIISRWGAHARQEVDARNISKWKQKRDVALNLFEKTLTNNTDRLLLRNFWTLWHERNSVEKVGKCCSTMKELLSQIAQIQTVNGGAADIEDEFATSFSPRQGVIAEMRTTGNRAKLNIEIDSAVFGAESSVGNVLSDYCNSDQSSLY